jgi:glycosyltransferase involved in cell wall biosynthesis
MHVIDFREKDCAGTIELCRKGLSEVHGMRVTTIEASSFSFITSTRLANAIKNDGVDVVIVDRVKDAIAAVSARKLVAKEQSNYKVIYSVSALSAMPHGVPTEVCRGIDCWVFDSAETEQAYASHEFIEVHGSVIIPPTTTLHLDVAKRGRQHEAVHVSMIGELTDGDRLQRVIRAVAACSERAVELHVYGTGKPRVIMPIVNEARHTDGLNVVWHGTTYDLADAIADTDVAVGTHSVAGNIDIFMRSQGIAVVEPEQIAEVTASDEALNAAGEASREEYVNTYSSERHVQQWSALINKLG